MINLAYWHNEFSWTYCTAHLFILNPLGFLIVVLGHGRLARVGAVAGGADRVLRGGAGGRGLRGLLLLPL